MAYFWYNGPTSGVSRAMTLPMEEASTEVPSGTERWSEGEEEVVLHVNVEHIPRSSRYSDAKPVDLPMDRLNHP